MKKRKLGLRGQKSDGSLSTAPVNAIEAFESEIQRQEDLLYGVALMFEGLSLLYAGQEAVMETYRKQLRNTIQTGQAAADKAWELLDQAKREPEKVEQIRRFKFSTFEGHPEPDELARRADILVRAYGRLFPDRPRSQPFSEQELRSLLSEASDEMS